MTIVTIDDWNDGEFKYCEDLVRSGGCKEVSREFVHDYLKLQRESASRDNREDVAAAITGLILAWRLKNR